MDIPAAKQQAPLFQHTSPPHKGLWCRSKEKRQQEEKLRSVRGLGEAGDEGDDLMAWVDRSRRLEEERAKADRLAKMFQQQVCPWHAHSALSSTLLCTVTAGRPRQCSGCAAVGHWLAAENTSGLVAKSNASRWRSWPCWWSLPCCMPYPGLFPGAMPVLVGFSMLLDGIGLMLNCCQDEGNEEDSDEDEKPAARELEGLRVKHDADELNAGETMILTMADRNILDERGELAEDGDELENVLTVSYMLFTGICQQLHAMAGHGAYCLLGVY